MKQFKKIILWGGFGGGCLMVSTFFIILLVIVIGLATNDHSTINVTSGQPNARLYDHSKESGATPIVINGWDEEWVNRFRMDAADPPYVTGEYIDNFIRKHYPQSPLIGYGDTIKEMSDYYGVAVGAFIGQTLKETTLGINSCGGRFNVGCIRWYEGSKFGAVDTAYGKFADIKDIETGIEYYFHLVRTNYINTGQVRYKEYLDKYSPSFENDQSSFKDIFWGALKSFGYDVDDTISKQDLSSPDEEVDGKINGSFVRKSSTNSNVTQLEGFDYSKTRLTDLVLKWKEPIAREMEKQEVSQEYLPLLLGILATESGGGGVADIFQSSESQGLSMNTISSEEESIRAGVSHFKNTLDKVKQYNKSIWAIPSGYNFGHAFIDYLNRTNQDWTIKVAEEYSATVVAPSLGNTTRQTYPYINNVSTIYDMPYAYTNGGNFHYVPMVMWYLGYSLEEIKDVALNGGNDALGGGKVTSKKYRYLFNKFLNEERKKENYSGDLVEIAKSQIGLPYSWGGGGKDGPTTGIYDPAVQDATNIVGFDCSGFTQFCYWQAYKVDIGDWTVPQESSGKVVSKAELEIGDLLFWGPSGSTYHVAMYIGNNELIESSTPGNPISIRPMRDYDFAVRPDISKGQKEE